MIEQPAHLPPSAQDALLRRTLIDTLVSTIAVQRERGTVEDVQAGRLGRVALLRGTAYPLILHPRLPVTVTILDYRLASGERQATVVHQEESIRIVPVILDSGSATHGVAGSTASTPVSDLKLVHHIRSVYYSRREAVDAHAQLLASPASFGIHEDMLRG